MLQEFREQHLTWDKANRRIYENVKANASDSKGRKLTVQVLNDGVVEDLTGTSLSLFWKTRNEKNKGLDAFDVVDASQGIFELYYTTGMLSNEGELRANLVLVDDLGRIVSDGFVIDVSPGIDDDAVESSDSFTALTKALVDVQNLEQNYAPRLNEVTAQLAQKGADINRLQNEKMDKNTTEISVQQINKNFGKLDETYMTDEFIAQFVDNTQPIHSTPPNDSVTRLKMSTSAVSKENTDFVKLGSINLLDLEDLTPNASLSVNDGNVVANNEYHSVTKYHSLLPGRSYVINSLGVRSFYDKNGDFISAAKPTTHDFVTADNTAFGRFAIENMLIQSGKAQLNEGSVLLPYEPHKLSIPHLHIDSKNVENKSIYAADTNFVEVVSDNLFPKDNYLEGKNFHNTTGNIVDSPPHRLTIMEAAPETEYAHAGAAKFGFRDSEGKWLGFAGIDQPTFTTPENTRTVWVIHEEGKNTQINQGGTLLPYDEYTLKVNGMMLTSDQHTNHDFKTYDTYIVGGKVDGTFSARSMPEQIDLDTKDSSWFYSLFDQLVTDYPFMKKTTLGNNDVGDPIHRYDLKEEPVEFVSEETKTIKMVLVAGMHGNEKAAIYTLYLAIKEICENVTADEYLDTLKGIHLLIVPVANPYGVNGNAPRKNENGVDIERNFPEGFRTSSPDQPTYGGEEPLTELGSILIDQLLQENKDAVLYTSFHNFFSHPDNYFLWTAGATKLQTHIGKSLVSKLTRKWQREHSFINQNVGYASGIVYASSGAQAMRYGIHASTFEICQEVLLEPEGVPFNETTFTLGVEGFINYLLLSLKNNVDYYNAQS